jgi:hypothetical protein
MVRRRYGDKPARPEQSQARRPTDARMIAKRRTLPLKGLQIAALSAVICITVAAAAGIAPARGDEHRLDFTIRNGRIAEPAPTLRVEEGDAVAIRFTSDRPVEIHLHGYDLEVAVAPGAEAVLRFDATFTGRFPAELHDDGGGSHEALFYLEVLPK